MIEQALGMLVWMLCLAVGIISISAAVLVAAIVVSVLKANKRANTNTPIHPAYGNLHLVDGDK